MSKIFLKILSLLSINKNYKNTITDFWGIKLQISIQVVAPMHAPLLDVHDLLVIVLCVAVHNSIHLSSVVMQVFTCTYKYICLSPTWFCTPLDSASYSRAQIFSPYAYDRKHLHASYHTLLTYQIIAKTKLLYRSNTTFCV